MKPKSNKSGLIITLIIAALVLGGYFSYWLFLGYKINSAFEGLRAKGIENSNIDFSGFPYRISAKIHDFSLPFGGIKFEAKEILISASPFSPHLWVLEGAKDIYFGEDQLVFSGFKASLRLGNDENSPRIRRLSIAGDSVKSGETPIIEKFNLHLIGEASKPFYAFSFEGEGLEKLFAPQDDFKIIIMRGLFNDTKMIDTDFDNWRKQGHISIKYGKINILERGFIKGGEFDNIEGEIGFNENKEVSGNLMGDLRVQFYANQSLERNDTKLFIENSRIELDETLKEMLK